MLGENVEPTECLEINLAPLCWGVQLQYISDVME